MSKHHDKKDDDTPWATPKTVSECYHHITPEMMDRAKQMRDMDGWWYIPVLDDNKAPTGKMFCAKFLNGGWSDTRAKKRFFREIEARLELNNKEFTTFLGCYIPVKGIDQSCAQSHPAILTTKLSGGCLTKMITETDTHSNKYLSEYSQLNILFGVAVQMAYLHKHNIVHRNLSPKVVWLDAARRPHIIDFSYARQMNEDDEQNGVMMSMVTNETECFTAPEVVDDENMTPAADVYSFGILAYMLFTKSDIDLSMSELVSGGRPEFNGDLVPSEAIRQLIEACWNQDYRARPAFEEIVEQLAAMDSELLLPGTDPEMRAKRYEKYRDHMMKAFRMKRK